MTTDKRPNIYLVGDDGGAVETNNPKAAQRFRELFGYRECDKQEYEKRLRWQEREDARVAEVEKKEDQKK